MFETIKGAIANLLKGKHTVVDDHTEPNGSVVSFPDRFDMTRAPGERPRLMCRWVRDPAQNALICVWSSDDVRQEAAQGHRIADAA